MSTNLIFVIAFSIILSVNMVGNTLVILVILKYRAMKTPINYLLLNMAMADIMVGVFFAPSFFYANNLFAHPTGTMGDALCKSATGRNVSWVASLASCYTLVCVAIERFYAVVRPTSIRHKITKRKLKRIVPACWIIAIIHTIPSFTSKIFDAEVYKCREKFNEYWQYVTYWFVWVLGAGAVPVSVMAVLYARVIHSLWIQNNGDATRLAVIKARKSITKKSITVSVFYAFCVFPVHILFFISIFYPHLFDDDNVFFKTSYCLVVLNSSANPFVYAFQCANFRKYLKIQLNCKGVVHPQEHEFP